MTKNDLDLTPLGLRLILAAGASALAMGTAGTWAQDAVDADGVDDEVELVGEEEEDVESTDDEIVVTGSRLRRSTFNSISPLQVIGGDVSREAGLIDAASILQNSTAATGQQIDDTFAGFVTDNGPGSNTIDLRSLGATRTLVLLNGRRLGPSGVEGAPRAPDIALIPSALVSQYELLLDGASSIYGSDAVAGVVNAQLRQDFDGLEVEAFGALPLHDGGEDYTLSAAYGKTTDRGFFGIGGEYRKQTSVALADRPWTNGCETNYEITENGDFRTVDLGFQAEFLAPFGIETELSPCLGRVIGGVAGVPDASFVYYTPGTTNLGIPNFSDTLVFSVPIDSDGDGILDVNPLDYNTFRKDNIDQDLFPQFENYNVLAYGEYVLDGDMNLTPYFEAMYSGRETIQNSAQGQFFPVVPAGNPFNICGTEAFAGGFDCALALGELFSNEEYREDFQQFYGGALPENFGRPRVSGPVDLQPVVAIEGDRSRTESKVEQYRFVGGLKGDLPALNFGSFEDWQFDVWGSYNLAKGQAARPGIRQDRLDLALGVFSTPADGTGALAEGTLTPCVNDLDADGDGVADNDLDASVTNGCLPVNLFAGSLYGGAGGDFATQAERNYLFDVRDFDTDYEQIIVSGFVGGTIFELPAGEVGFGVGAEYRYDEIDSQPDDIARDGLFFGFFADQGAAASSDIYSLFAETNIPLLGNLPLIEELTFEASGRYTNVTLKNPDLDVEEDAEDFTYSLKAGWRPVSSLLVRGTYGTSFRAPNLGEFGLRGQTGFLNVFDPCAVPENAFNPLTGEYLPAGDQRDGQTLENCVREGVDPTSVGINGNTVAQVFSTEVESGAGLGLEPETSRSYTVGFSFEQPFFDSFDLTIGMTHFDIEIENTIIEPGAQFIVNDCFLRQEATRSTFCDRISRDAETGRFDIVNVGFINRDLETTAGIDYNLLFLKDFTAFDYPMTFGYDLRVTQTSERDLKFTNEDGTIDLNEFDGQFGVPEWNGIGTARLDIGEYRLTWATRYIGSVTQNPDGIDAFSDVFGSGFDADGNQFFGDTCLGPSEGDVLCRDFAEADDYYLHTASLYYRGDTWTIGGGVRNVFDTAPPLVDGNEFGASINNVPLGVGYDLNGRAYFLNVSKQF